MGHAHHVAHLSLRLFDELQHLHNLTGDDREALRAGAVLHDVGKVHGDRGHHKTSLRLVLRSSVLNWDQRDRLLVGSIARYHRKALPSPSHDHFAALNVADRRRVCLLGGLVRLADALDTRHLRVVRDLNCRTTGKEITLHCASGKAADLEVNRAHQKADLLSIALGRSVRIAWHRQQMNPASTL